MATKRVFHLLKRDEKRTCDLGCKHTVTVHRVMHLEQLGTARKFIKNLNYVSDGYGQVRIAVDAEGRVWRSAPNWDGYQGWT